MVFSVKKYLLYLWLMRMVQLQNDKTIDLRYKEQII